MKIVKLTRLGTHRVLSSVEGMTFGVDSEFERSNAPGEIVVHVRDYRSPNEHRDWQVWTLGPEDYEVVAA